MIITNNPIVDKDLAYIHGSIPIDQLRDSEIVITGCAGFLGFYFMQYLAHYSNKLGVRRIIGLDVFLLGKPSWLQMLQEKYANLIEVRSFNVACDQIESIVGVGNVTHVIHMASIASPTFYRQYPIETVDANIWGLRSLLNYYRESKKLRGFLFFSSSEIYGDPVASAIPTDEEYRGNVSCVGPRACYDESKRFGETLCQLFAKTYNMPITVVRPFNNYGPGMNINDKRLPADFARCVVERRDMIIFSDGSPTRTFCYVADAIIGYFKCLLYGQYDYFNIGMDYPEINVRYLSEIYQLAAREIFDFNLNVSFQKNEDPEYLTDNPNRRCPVIKKARQLLKYHPQILVEDGVRHYLNYLKFEMRL